LKPGRKDSILSFYLISDNISLINGGGSLINGGANMANKNGTRITQI